jgi:hypothetical protein
LFDQHEPFFRVVARALLSARFFCVAVVLFSSARFVVKLVSTLVNFCSKIGFYAFSARFVVKLVSTRFGEAHGNDRVRDLPL